MSQGNAGPPALARYTHWGRRHALGVSEAQRRSSESEMLMFMYHYLQIFRDDGHTLVNLHNCIPSEAYPMLQGRAVAARHFRGRAARKYSKIAG